MLRKIGTAHARVFGDAGCTDEDPPMHDAATAHRHRNVERVVAHLQDSIRAGSPLPDLAALAAVAHQSPHHFHRVYRALAGETLGQTTARLRLSQAVHLLGEPGRSITEVALAVGYQTPQALARAFRALLQVSPSSLRQAPAIRAQTLQQLATPALAPHAAPAPLQVTVQWLEPLEVVVLRQRGAFDDLDRGFGRIAAWAERAGVIEHLHALIGVPLSDHRDVPAQQHLFECGMAFATAVAPPAPLHVRVLGEGALAVLRHTGSYAGLEDALDRLLADWLPGSGHALRDAPLHYLYLDDPETVAEADLRADIRVPVVAVA
ncbi:AraC family transcriptional regulator [Xanthomonas campestris pv. raphani]|uniref:AraC family transcriptional regulator n=2 Tax=Xanthomonas campestris TaxID=339 RepID=UPI002B22A277|nr:AraC family transcriptional regulator [Xanthomonas campestris]MEA9737608.1 AraC family transcriptional regulator [Xanthomonas campestris pv. raphani]MEA9773343.1 AraC family transcriptional regulator [Xanthomonas campestris pv. raphani]MEA9801442.1 AraC family transcriptional regulator [Xanthomonas campestris pv. raphani]MEA9831746.1 AraC family transcriptional regulator [Xanthomonas campestris pv. raphani]MEA9950813.1 AraC family transcriptional regulator [Xanthomonas campestris pv. raphan